MRETGWLIESNWPGRGGSPLWLRLYSYVTDGVQQLPKPEWTEKSELGLRFGRRADAEGFALLYPQMCCLAKITEHIWIDGRVATERESRLREELENKEYPHVAWCNGDRRFPAGGRDIRVAV